MAALRRGGVGLARQPPPPPLPRSFSGVFVALGSVINRPYLCAARVVLEIVLGGWLGCCKCGKCAENLAEVASRWVFLQLALAQLGCFT